MAIVLGFPRLRPLARFLRLWPLVLLVVCGLVAATGARAALAEGETRRVALVVGNSEYRSVAPLKNAARDAREIARTLVSLGFEVIDRTDVTRREFETALEAFYESSAGADAAVIFYSGHGFQLNGVNYLVPIDATLRDRARIGEETLRLDEIASRAGGENRQTLIFLDACRNNPLPPSLKDRGPSEGLAQLETGSGTFIAFATQPGNITRDGAGAHSPFTSALLDHMPTPGISISDMMIRVRNSVEVATLQTQTPWDQSSLRSQFYFNPAVEEDAGGELTDEDREMLLALDPAMRRKFEAKFGIRIDEKDMPVEEDPVQIAAIQPMVRIEAAEEMDETDGEPTGDAPAEEAAAEETLPADAAAAAETETARDGDDGTEEPLPFGATLQILPGAPVEDAAPPTEPSAGTSQPPVVASLAPAASAAARPAAPIGSSAVSPYDPARPAAVSQSSIVPRQGGQSIASLDRSAPDARVATTAGPDRLVSSAASSATVGASASDRSTYEIAALSSAERSVAFGAATPRSVAPVRSPFLRIVGEDVTPTSLDADPSTPKTRLAAVDPAQIDLLSKGPPDKPDEAAEEPFPAATLPPQVPSSVPAAALPADLPAAVQTELARLGCYRNRVDGDWGSGSARALLRYYVNKKVDPDILEPNGDLYARLTAEDSVVCTRTETQPTVRSQPKSPAIAARPQRQQPAAVSRPARSKPAVASRPAKQKPATRVSRPQAPKNPTRTVATRKATAAPAKRQAAAASSPSKSLKKSMSLGGFR